MIAGYHWFTDWGRDTMISLEGLTLTTGRHAEAGYILRTFAHYIRDGLIPNMFPEGETAGPLPHRRRHALVLPRRSTATSQATDDRETLAALLPRLIEIVDRHIEGTRFGIGVDPARRPAPPGAPRAISSPGWTPRSATGSSRRGAARRSRSTRSGTTRCGCWKAGSREEPRRRGRRAATPSTPSRRRRSFNARFWYEPGGYLYDVVDGEQGDDPACRPNQLFAISLRAPGARPIAVGAGAGRGAASGC